MVVLLHQVRPVSTKQKFTPTHNNARTQDGVMVSHMRLIDVDGVSTVKFTDALIALLCYVGNEFYVRWKNLGVHPA